MTRLATFLAVVLAVALAGGCGRDDGDDPGRATTRLTEPADAVSEPLMLALAQAKNFHHKADVYLKDGRVEEAIAEVQRVLTIPFPAGAAEGDDVVLDARARLAKLWVLAGDHAQALRVVDDGLAGARRESFFVANLHTVRGEVLEAAAATLTDSDPAAARERLRQALAAYDRSIAINERLQRRLLEEARP